MKRRKPEPEPSAATTAPPDEATADPPADSGSAGGEQRRVYVGTGFYWPVLVGVVLALAVLALVLQNTQRVVVEWLWFDIDVPLVVLLLVTALSAVMLTEIVGWVWRRRRRRALRDREELKRLRG